MNILITGGFGSIGVVVVEECLSRGHTVSVFEIPNKRTERLARRYSRRNVGVFFGDLGHAGDISRAVVGQDVVLHLAAILPPLSDARPELCQAVNVGGTANLIQALHTADTPAALVLVSSASVMGPTQKQIPPLQPDDPVVPTDVYSRTKVEAEALVAAAGLRYCILRLAAVLPTTINYSAVFSMIRLIFDMPLDARCEIVVDLDVAYALVSAAENLAGSGGVAGKRGFIAGGQGQGCQIRTRDLVDKVFVPLGLDVPDASLFSPELDSYYLDWYDTGEMQSLLRYQRYSMAQWQAIVLKKTRFIRPFVCLFKGSIMKWIEKQSPRYQACPGE